MKRFFYFHHLKYWVAGTLSLFCFTEGWAQNVGVSETHHKGDLYFYWGWNRGFYTQSDIHLHGKTYDFTLFDVVAKDHQTPFELNAYFNPVQATIPQTNFRIGYFFHDHYNLSFGFDHMKYVVQKYQTVKISGEIRETGMVYDGIYRNDAIVISPDFLELEHSNGLNYINFELRRFDQIFNFNKIKVNLTEGISIGALVPRTDAELLNFEDNDRFHLSGYGVGAIAALNLTFFNHFFLQTEAKGGFIDMPSLRTTPYSSDTGEQSFFFAQFNFVFGWVFHLQKPQASIDGG